MAQNVQNVTLSLTLPITCHICLGKVRHPVICANNHVFCSVCIEVWLKNNSQCPACRIPITTDNPCKEVIGGTSESNPVFSPGVRNQLRKTRLELLHKEYEDEIESMQKELEELKGKNASLELQLKSVLHPVTLAMSDKTQENPQPSGENHVNPETLAVWTQKLQAANDMYEKAKDDMEKLMEVNKKLRLENSSLVRDNLRLKAEVGSRSPQKYGRFTVAALQSKLEQCERETNRLKKALERSDKYIEELESQASQLKSACDQMKNVSSENEVPVPMEDKESDAATNEIVLLKSPDECIDQNCSCARRSPALEAASGLLGSSNDVCLNSASQGCSDDSAAQCSARRDSFTDPQEGLLDVAGTDMDTCSESTWDKIDDCASYKEELYDLPDPCTPLSLSCLQLNTPSNKDDPVAKQESTRKPTPTFLRKLEFEDFSETSDDCNKDSPEHSASSCESGESKATRFTSDKPVFWNRCQTRFDDENLDFEGSEPNIVTRDSGESSEKLSEKVNNPTLPKKLHSTRSSEMNRTRTSSEASMDAAYLDKISELDSMMSESDNSKSPYYTSKSSSDLDNSCKSTQCPDLLNDKEKAMKERNEQNSLKCPLSSNPCPLSSNPAGEENEWKSATFSILSPSTLDITEPFPLFAGRTSETSEIKPQSFLFPRELSPNFLFSSSQGSFEEQKLGSSLFKMAPELQNLHNQLQSPWSSSFVPDRKAKSIHASAKRKIQSGLCSASPSKTTKN